MIVVLLGSGFSSFIEHVEVEGQIEFKLSRDNIQELEGHQRLIYKARLAGQSLIIISGKWHRYEGLDYDELTEVYNFINGKYDIDTWVVTSATGALTEKIKVGEWCQIKGVISTDHMVGKKSVNSTQYNSIISLPQAIYAHQQGPSLGTVSEYKMLNLLGADVVGMSILPEANYLASIDSRYYLLSLQVCTYHPLDQIVEPTHTQVLEIAEKSVVDLVNIIERIQ